MAPLNKEVHMGLSLHLPWPWLHSSIFGSHHAPQAPVQDKIIPTPAPLAPSSPSSSVASIPATTTKPAVSVEGMDFGAVMRTGRDVRLNTWSRETLIGAVGHRYSSVQPDEGGRIPLYRWKTKTGRVFYEVFDPVSGYSIVLYEQIGDDNSKCVEVPESMGFS